MINHLVMKRYLARYLKLKKRTPYTLSIVINEWLKSYPFALFWFSFSVVSVKLSFRPVLVFLFVAPLPSFVFPFSTSLWNILCLKMMRATRSIVKTSTRITSATSKSHIISRKTSSRVILYSSMFVTLNRLIAIMQLDLKVPEVTEEWQAVGALP